MNTVKLILAALFLISLPTIAQELSISKIAEAELSKDARNGKYGGTIVRGDEAAVFYVINNDKSGAKIEDYLIKMKGGESSFKEKLYSPSEAKENFPWYIQKEQVENVRNSSGDWLKATRAFGGGMKIERGRMIKRYELGIYVDQVFESEENVKPKAGDIWRILPGGYKSLSDVDAIEEAYGFYMELDKFGQELIMPADAKLLAAGVITEKVSLKQDQKYAANRVAVLTLDGSDFDNIPYDIYELPYTATTIVSGLGQDDNLVSLFVPLNGPTTVASLKHLYWKDNKNVFTVMRFTDDRKLVDSVSWNSKLMWGDFNILNGDGSTFVLGKGDGGFDGWFRGMQYKKLDAFQITKIKDGKVIYNTFIDEDMIDEKLQGPRGEKVKFKPYLFNSAFTEIVNLPNGDDLAIGWNPTEMYAFQLSSSGELRTMYYIPYTGKDGDTPIYGYQYQIYGDKLYLVVNQQPIGFSNETKVNVKVTQTTRTTTVTRLNDVYLQSMVFRIDINNAEISNRLAMDGSDFYTMGSYPALFTEEGIYFTGREKGPKGKTTYVAKIDVK